MEGKDIGWWCTRRASADLSIFRFIQVGNLDLTLIRIPVIPLLLVETLILVNLGLEGDLWLLVKMI